LVDQYSYDPYGNATSVTQAVTNPFRFTGAVWDSSTGLYKMGERYYDPSTGRFTQLDPAGTGYVYASDDPVNLTDPSGLFSEKDEPSGGPDAPGVNSSVSGPGFIGAQISLDLMKILYRKAGPQNFKKFLAALAKGMASSKYDDDGIKWLTKPVGSYTYELKIIGSAQRLLGKIEDGVLVFDEFRGKGPGK
jgi:RHS repeat-associated protein